MCSLSRDDFGRLDSARFICWGEEGLLDGWRYLAWKGLCLCHSYILNSALGKKSDDLDLKMSLSEARNGVTCVRNKTWVCAWEQLARQAPGVRVCVHGLDHSIAQKTLQSCTLAHATPPVRSPSRLSSAFLLKLAFVKPQCLTAGQTFFLQNKINSWTRRLSRLQPTRALKEQEHTEEQRAGRLALRAGMCSQEELSK